MEAKFNAFETRTWRSFPPYLVPFRRDFAFSASFTVRNSTIDLAFGASRKKDKTGSPGAMVRDKAAEDRSQYVNKDSRILLSLHPNSQLLLQPANERRKDTTGSVGDVVEVRAAEK